MTTTMHEFQHKLSRQALHIDYLRLRCGKEEPFTKHVTTKAKKIGAHIAFSEWDVVLFIPCRELYPEELIKIYSDTTLAGAIAGSAGFFNYLWHHPINKNWTQRILQRDKTISLLVSLRFTDAFRRKFGLGAELLFCSFLRRTLDSDEELASVSAIVAHSVGWNDATIVLDAVPGQEHRLLKTLTRIRYCTERDLAASESATRVIAATYSHLLGNLETYADETLQFGSFRESVKSARLLVRVNPDVEAPLRLLLNTKIREVFKSESSGADFKTDHTGSELGHYNFSADITKAFDDDNAVPIIQGFRKIIDDYLTEHNHPDEASFPETTTEITFDEPYLRTLNGNAGGDAPAVVPHSALASPPEIPGTTLSARYKKRLEEFLETEPANLLKGHAAMTAHRLAILLGTIITYLDDPVRSSVVGHLCRFLDATFERVLRRSDRAGKEDLCHILEYALHQATDGLTQFQHDANSLGLSGRGGYNRLIQAVEEFIDQVVAPFHLDLVPLVTFGLRPSNDGTTLQYWIDLPFSTAFVPERWYVAYHDVGRMCWQRSFEWRLDSYRVWQQFSRDVIAIESHDRDNDRQEFVLGRDVVEELFPNYLLLNIVCPGDTRTLDRLMVAKEFLTRPRPALIRSLTVRLVLDVLLMLHERRNERRRQPGRRQGPTSDDADAQKFIHALKEQEDVRERSVAIAFEWWKDWSVIHRWLTAKGKRGDTAVREVSRLMEDAATSLRDVIGGMKHTFSGTDAAQAFESTTTLVSTPAFKADALHVVNRVIGLLAVRGRDYATRRKESFAVFDPSAVDFGFALGKIKVMRRTAEKATANDILKYRKALEEGRVFASGPESPALARILTASGEASRSSDASKRHPSMLSCLSTILSLWHSAVTRDPGKGREYPPDLLERLQKLKVVRREPF